ncbi:MAG: TlpA family protein disulfide reductase, partial [Dysgonamonadaceae bacterium]|nr:TlpA family protein disulfide reductase [Dysgonamonadaceae bacterium]
DYTEYYQGTQNTNAQLEVLESFMKKKGSIKPEIQKLIDDIYQIEKSFKAETNSVRKAKMEESLKDKLRQILGFTEVLDALNEWTKEDYYKSRIEKNDSIITEPVLREWLTASLIFSNFEYTRIPMSDTYQQIFNERVSNPFLRDKLLKINDYYTEIQSGKVEHEESVKNLGNLSGEGEEIFRQLVEPYRGKVIYLDVWGTWCGPCREQMKHVREIEERLADKDIIFMYLANNSPETTWRNFIKELNLTGENIVHYRLTSANQQAVEAKLKIHAYPSYFIIDREGKMVNDNPSPPEERDRLIGELEKILGK